MNYSFLLFLIFSTCSLQSVDLHLKHPFKKKYFKKGCSAGNRFSQGTFIKSFPWPFKRNGTIEQQLPEVKLHIAENQKDYYTWDSYVRYSIEVSDLKDGDSKYGEINSSEVVLQIDFIPSPEAEEINKKIAEKEQDHRGLSLLKKFTCFNCHADKTALTGPSFSRIADRYQKDSSAIRTLAHTILNGSSGKWGEMKMPSNPDLTVEETKKITEYILTQGKKKNSWVLPGLEGAFQIVKKPTNLENGVYILKASYTSTSLMKAQDIKVLQIE